jgi:phage portal protein BeeE
MGSWLVPQRKSWSEPPFWASDILRFPFLSASTSTEERIENDFEGYVNGAYKGNGIVFGCIDRRQQVLSQGRLQYRRYRDGSPVGWFGNSTLGLLERPWPKGSAGQLMASMEYNASLAGNFYATTCDDQGRLGRAARGNVRIVRMRPDWTKLVIEAPSGDPYGLDARVIAYRYQPRLGDGATTILLPEETCHYAPLPDPTARFRGMSWLTPVIREIQADKAAMVHKLNFFNNGATPSVAVKFDRDTSPQAFNDFVAKFNATHKGTRNAYKPLFLTGGADITPLTMDFKQLDFKLTTAAGETRISVAGGVPAAILGITEGLSGGSLNEGNFAASKRLFVDTTCEDLWREMGPALEVFAKPPADARLEVNGNDIPFLRENATDVAVVQAKVAEALSNLLMNGWNPDAAVQYIVSNDLKELLGQHSGLYSVQLQRPLESMPILGEPDRTNGRHNGVPTLT